MLWLACSAICCADCPAPFTATCTKRAGLPPYPKAAEGKIDHSTAACHAS